MRIKALACLSSRSPAISSPLASNLAVHIRRVFGSGVYCHEVVLSISSSVPDLGTETYVAVELIMGGWRMDEGLSECIWALSLTLCRFCSSERRDGDGASLFSTLR